MTTKIDWMTGCATALVTPFRKDGSIDDERFRELVVRQVRGGVRLLVPCGTTGESVTMDESERMLVIRMTVEVAKRFKARVIAGTGSNNTAGTIDFTRKAREAGADAALVVAPYYNKPTQEGLFAHFAEIAKSVKGFPIMLYNVPGRTSSNISAETTLRLAAKFDNIVATKESSRVTTRRPFHSSLSAATAWFRLFRTSCQKKRQRWSSMHLPAHSLGRDEFTTGSCR
jgi:4-hydroxy-tetrahydrodipicolinate synthase